MSVPSANTRARNPKRNPAERQGWKICIGEVPVGVLLMVSFQRYRPPRTGAFNSAPASCGALPIAQSRDNCLLPLADDEAVWIGLRPTDEERTVLACTAVETGNGAALDAVSGGSLSWPPMLAELTGVAVPPAHAIEGIARPSRGWWPIVRVGIGPRAPRVRALRIFAIPSHSRRRVAPPPALAPLHTPSPQSPAASPDAPSIERASDTRWILARATALELRLVTPDEYFDATGERPAPFDPDAAYRGWRLP